MKAVVIVMYYIAIINKVILSNARLFTISTEGCTIPSFRNTNISDVSLKNVLESVAHRTKCTESIRLITSNSSHLWVNQNVYEDYNVYQPNELYCCYTNFSAINNIANINYGNCIQFSTIIKAEHEFVRTECYYYDNKIYDDFFVFTPKDKCYTRGNAGYNILIIGIESMSRLNFQRTMPLTSRFLIDRGSIQMRGYNKLGYNSFPNLFPILTGKSFKDVLHKCKTDNVIDTYKCQFIWDAFKIAGYKTILGSDSIAGLLGTYEYSLNKIPTDFYLQPLMFEIGNLFQNKDYNFHVCFSNKYFYKVLLDYIGGIINHLKSTRWFGIFWEESVSHEYLELPRIMDSDYVSMLENFNDYLNDTVLIFIGDHGMRWGKLAKTEIGRQEERLPLLEALFPERFQNEYPLAFNNFQVNSNRLTTPYDLYNTLLDLTNLENLRDDNISNRMKLIDSRTNKASLFLPISVKRSCHSIGIEDHWCACSLGQRIKDNNKIRISASRYIVGHINNILSAYPQCHKLTLKKILSTNAVQTRENKGNIFTVLIKTTPGEAVFDSTLYRKRKSWTVSGIVSRLNLYHNQSICVNDAIIKLYCYCI